MSAVIIFGATSDVGRNIFSKLYKSHREIVIVGRDDKKLQAMSRGLDSTKIISIKMDLSDIDGYKALFYKLRQRCLPSSMIWCAGVHDVRPLSSISASHLDELYSLNYKAPMMALKQFANRKNSDSSVARSFVYISSIAQKIGEPALSVYSGTKAAMTASIRSLATELADKNILVNSVSPGWLRSQTANKMADFLGADLLQEITKQYPLGVGQVSDVSDLVVFLIENNRWITGQDIVIDGGRTNI